MHFLRLIRFPNLLIIAATQYLMRWCIIHPMLQINGFELQFSNFHFFLLVLSTVLITAGGYVINDYFDRKTDLINHPDTVIIGKHINRRAAMAMHIVFNVIAIALGFYLAMVIGIFSVGYIFIIISGILWFYSTTYKRQFLIGNVIVAILSAMVPFMVLLFEIPLLNKEYGKFLILHNTNFNYIIFWILGFSFFAFVTTLIREIIKDTEDLEGDNAYGRNSVPIVLGIEITKTIIYILSFITVSSILFVYFTFINDRITLFYMIFLLLVPFVFLVYYIANADDKKNYTIASFIMKLIMMFGVLYAGVVYFIIIQKFV